GGDFWLWAPRKLGRGLDRTLQCRAVWIASVLFATQNRQSVGADRSSHGVRLGRDVLLRRGGQRQRASRPPSEFELGGRGVPVRRYCRAGGKCTLHFDDDCCVGDLRSVAARGKIPHDLGLIFRRHKTLSSASVVSLGPAVQPDGKPVLQFLDDKGNVISE